MEHPRFGVTRTLARPTQSRMAASASMEQTHLAAMQGPAAKGGLWQARRALSSTRTRAVGLEPVYRAGCWDLHIGPPWSCRIAVSSTSSLYRASAGAAPVNWGLDGIDGHLAGFLYGGRHVLSAVHAKRFADAAEFACRRAFRAVHSERQTVIHDMTQDLMPPEDSAEEGEMARPNASAEAGPFTRFYRDKWDRVRKFLMHLGAESQDADDLAQQVFINLLGASTPLSSIRTPNTYLRTIAAHVFSEMREREQRGQQHVVADSELAEEMDGCTGDVVADEAGALDARRELLEITAGFSESERIVFLLKLQGFSAPEMARRSGLTVYQIERRLTAVNERLELLRSQRNAGKGK